MSSPPVAARAVQSDSSIGQGSVCAALSTWSFGALAVEECVPYLLNGCSALDAVEKGINKVSYCSSSTSSIINNSHMWWKQSFYIAIGDHVSNGYYSWLMNGIGISNFTAKLSVAFAAERLMLTQQNVPHWYDYQRCRIAMTIHWQLTEEIILFRLTIRSQHFNLTKITKQNKTNVRNTFKSKKPVSILILAISMSQQLRWSDIFLLFPIDRSSWTTKSNTT